MLQDGYINTLIGQKCTFYMQKRDTMRACWNRSSSNWTRRITNSLNYKLDELRIRGITNSSNEWTHQTNELDEQTNS